VLLLGMPADEFRCKHSKAGQYEQITTENILYFEALPVNITKNDEKSRKVHLRAKMRGTSVFRVFCALLFMHFF
jgi:hypothetical protein